MGYIFETYICAFQRLQLCVKFDIYVWLEWASPCPEDDSLRGSTHYENNWLLGSIVHLYDAAFKCVHQENEEAVWAHFTSLGAFKCVHPASGVKWSRNIVVKIFGAFR